MKYPIFNSIITVIETELAVRGIKPTKFKVWQDGTLHATGLEIAFDLPHHASGVRQITINFDWDSFREAKLAAALEGMDQHPLLKRKKLLDSKAALTLDIETAWHFDEQQILGPAAVSDTALRKVDTKTPAEDERTAYASSWIRALNTQIMQSLPNENVISRWHLEIEGDLHGKYVSNMSLLAYHQFPLYAMQQLAEVHSQIRLSIQRINLRMLRVLRLAGKTRPEAA